MFQESKYDEASKNNVKDYYVTAPGTSVDKPKPGTKWWDSILPSQNPVRRGIISTGASSTMTVDDEDVDDELDDGFADGIDNGIDGTTEETEAGAETITQIGQPNGPRFHQKRSGPKHIGNRVKYGVCSIQIDSTQQFLMLSQQGSKPSGK